MFVKYCPMRRLRNLTGVYNERTWQSEERVGVDRRIKNRFNRRVNLKSYTSIGLLDLVVYFEYKMKRTY